MTGNKFLKNKNGFTLLELTAAVAIFSVVVLSATQIFKNVLEGQRSAVAAQDIQESVRYALAVMSKEIRMSQKDDGSCTTAGNKIYEASAGNDELYFKNSSGECVAYYLSNNTLMVDRNGNIASTTPKSVKISNLKFSIVDDGQVSQSRLTIKLDVEAKGKEMHSQPMVIQTTISSRYYE